MKLKPVFRSRSVGNWASPLRILVGQCMVSSESFAHEGAVLHVE